MFFQCSPSSPDCQHGCHLPCLFLTCLSQILLVTSFSCFLFSYLACYFRILLVTFSLACYFRILLVIFVSCLLFSYLACYFLSCLYFEIKFPAMECSNFFYICKKTWILWTDYKCTRLIAKGNTLICNQIQFTCQNHC